MDNDESFQSAVIKEFGPSVVDKKGKIDRDRLARAIFNNPDKRRKLNQMSHPRIFRRILTTLIRLKFKEKKQLVVLDAPLLFESKILEYFCYPIIVVYTEDAQV